jgi:hypothetical protein
VAKPNPVEPCFADLQPLLAIAGQAQPARGAYTERCSDVSGERARLGRSSVRPAPNIGGVAITKRWDDFERLCEPRGWLSRNDVVEKKPPIGN